MKKIIFSFSDNNLLESSIEPILNKIMNLAKEQQFSMVLCHSLRSIVSEILSNIISHAYMFEQSEQSIALEISITNDETILVKTRNLIANENVGPITLLINRINLLSQQELKDLQQKTLQENLNASGSPRIGLILIRRRSCKPIVCNFDPYNDKISYINLEIELNKNIQDNFTKEQTKRTPQVNFNIPNQLFEISGVSFPEDAESYYRDIESWINEHEQYITELPEPVIKIDLDYFNSISLKNIVRMVRCFLSLSPDKFSIKWYYDSDDDISYEEGMEMSEILHKDFTFIQKK